MAYSGAVDDSFVKQVSELFTSKGGLVVFVQLQASDETLLQRVTSQSRVDLRQGKMTDPEHLRQMLKTRDMHTSVQYPDVLKIVTENYTPIDAARLIVHTFRLHNNHN